MSKDLIIEGAQSKNFITWDDIREKKVLSKAKTEIALHPAHRKIILGAKGTGKSIIPCIKANILFSKDKYFNAFGFRKYKDQATQKLSSLFINSVSQLEQYGLGQKYEYETKTHKAAIYRMKNKRNLNKNQAFQFGSLDNITGSTDGLAPNNGGYYGLITIDEPVVAGDVGKPDKIPTKLKWDTDISILTDNLARHNDGYNTRNGKEIKTEIYFTMNNWGKHPLINEVDDVLPEEEFMQYVFGEDIENILGKKEVVEKLFSNDKWIEKFIKNNTLSKYKKDNDTLYTRMTKFANPNNWSGTNKAKILADIKKALIENNKQKLCILLGTQSEPEIDTEMLSYDIRDFNETTLDEIEKEKYVPKSITYSWDIDTSRVLTLSPVFLMEKETTEYNLFGGMLVRKIEHKIFCDKQIEIMANGTGKIGERNEMYRKIMIETMKDHWAKIKNKPKNGAIIAIDDKRQEYLYQLQKMREPWMKLFRPFKQHGDFDIQARQDLMTLGFDNKVLYLHPENKNFKQDVRVCIKREYNDDRRKTTGRDNYLDRIDSLENGFLSYASMIWKTRKKVNNV